MPKVIAGDKKVLSEMLVEVLHCLLLRKLFVTEKNMSSCRLRKKYFALQPCSSILVLTSLIGGINAELTEIFGKEQVFLNK